MAEIGLRFQPDVALLPVTTFRIPMTMGEESAVRAVLHYSGLTRHRMALRDGLVKLDLKPRSLSSKRVKAGLLRNAHQQEWVIPTLFILLPQLVDRYQIKIHISDFRQQPMQGYLVDHRTGE